MEISLYQVDAFASKLFEGNPAAVCPLNEWLPDETMQSIAAENNLSETAFFVPKHNLGQLLKLDLRGVIITSKSTRYDFVSRFFAPKYGIPEDPVTGSAYTQLAPYWASKIGSNRFRAKQLSSRGGELICELVDDRVLIYGRAVKYLEGKINIET